MIEIKDLAYSYNKSPVLDEINLQINDGEYMAIIGMNGSGKSTLLKCILGLNPIKRDMILIDGVDVNDFNDYQKIGYVEQIKHNKSDIPITGYEYYKLISRDNTRIEAAIKATNTGEFIHDNMSNLSGGQRQKIIIGRALLYDIKYLFLDEPNTGLDFTSRKDLYDLIFQLNEAGITVIIISHHLDEITCKVSKIYNLDNKILEERDLDDCQYC